MNEFDSHAYSEFFSKRYAQPEVPADIPTLQRIDSEDLVERYLGFHAVFLEVGVISSLNVITEKSYRIAEQKNPENPVISPQTSQEAARLLSSDITNKMTAGEQQIVDRALERFSATAHVLYQRCDTLPQVPQAMFPRSKIPFPPKPHIRGKVPC